MRHKLLSSLAVICSLGGAHSALAADMATKAPPAPIAPAAAYNWAGWYVGGNIGYGWGGSSDPNVSFVDPGAAVGFAGYFAAGGNVTPNLHPIGVVGGGEVATTGHSPRVGSVDLSLISKVPELKVRRRTPSCR